MKQQNMNLFFKKGWMLFFVALILASCSETADYSHLTDISGGSPFDPSKPIEVTDFMPKKGGVGTRLIVYGNNFGNDTTKLRVTIGGKAAPVINTLGTSLLCMVPEKAFTGDIPTFEKTDGARVTEDELYAAWVASFPQPQQASWQELLAEMKEQQTPEAKLYKTLDRIEALISHNESDLDTWLPLEYDLQYTYGKKEMDQIPYMQKLRQAVDAWTTEKNNEKNGTGKMPQ